MGRKSLSWQISREPFEIFAQIFFCLEAMILRYILKEANNKKNFLGAIPKRLSPMGKRLSVDSTIFPILKTSSGTKLNEIDQHLSLDDSKSKKLFPTIGSISSQDSGINMSFHEQDFLTNSDEKEQRSNSESSVCRKTKKVKSEIRMDKNGEESLGTKWHSVPKNIWNATVEVSI